MEKVKLFHLSSTMDQNSFCLLLFCLVGYFCLFVFSIGVLELLCWKHRFPQRLSHPWVIVWDSILEGILDHGQERLEAVHRPLQGSQLGPRSILPVTQHRGGTDFSPVSWFMVLDPTALTKSLLSMNRYQVVVEGRSDKGCVIYIVWDNDLDITN